MPSLVEPTVAVRESFLAAMREFADEGRTGGDTSVGRDLVEWGERWGDSYLICARHQRSLRWSVDS